VRLKAVVEQLAQKNRQPVILLAHSMGNKVVHYFLNYIERLPNGTDWINKNIHSFLAVRFHSLSSSLPIIEITDPS
jgi:predicted alpha/beta hydrolase family esterase